MTSDNFPLPTDLRTRPWTIDAWIVGEVSSGIYEKYVQVRPNDIVADVGACFGAFTVVAAKKAAIVYAFEPDPANFELLKQNMVMLRLEDRVTWENVAVLDQPGEALLKEDPSNTGGHSISDQGTIPVKVISLDTRLSKLDFLKIDAEGSEDKILRGAVRLLRENNVRIAAEIHSAEKLYRIRDSLVQLGYTVGWEPHVICWLLWAWKEQ